MAGKRRLGLAIGHDLTYFGDLMSNWKTTIPGCFGVTDKIFASHSLDEERAAALRRRLIAENVDKQTIEEGFEDWLASQTWNTDHSQAQMVKVKTYFGL